MLPPSGDVKSGLLKPTSLIFADPREEKDSTAVKLLYRVAAIVIAFGLEAWPTMVPVPRLCSWVNPVLDLNTTYLRLIGSPGP